MQAKNDCVLVVFLRENMENLVPPKWELDARGLGRALRLRLTLHHVHGRGSVSELPSAFRGTPGHLGGSNAKPHAPRHARARAHTRSQLIPRRVARPTA